MQLKDRYDRSDLRQLNTVSVLRLLRRHGAMSRAQIAADLGLTRATVSNIAADLIAATLLNETAYTAGGAGRPGLLLNVNAAYGCMVASEIDLDRISVAVADFEQSIFWQDERLLKDTASAEETLAVAADMTARAVAAGARRNLKCLGIGVAWAGLVSHEKGRLVYGPISGWEDIPLKTVWEERFQVPVYVENEACAAAIGLHRGIQDAGADLIYLSLGVGLAAGVMVEGGLLRGRQGFAGQVGHMHFADNGILCGCGKTGCWVTEIGASALQRKLAANGVLIPADLSAGIDWLDLVAEQAQAGDPAVLKVLEAVGRQVGAGAAQLVQAFNPAALVVGGRLGKVMRVVETVIHDTIRANALPSMVADMEFYVSETGADPLAGNLATVFDATMKNPPLERV